MQKIRLITVVLILVAGCAAGQNADAPKAPVVTELDFEAMESQIEEGIFPKTTSVLVNKNGNLVYEAYFKEGRTDLLNDTRSVSKSITALAVGVAIEQGKLSGVEQKVLPFFLQELKETNKNKIRDDIRLEDLLTMSCALSANDYDDNSPGNENVMHEQSNWITWAVNLPIEENYKRDETGLGPFRYATINAFLAGQVIERATGQPVDSLINDTLLKPLGISDYRFQYSPSGEAMTGGGLKLQANDLLRIGQMVLDGGKYRDIQVVPQEWISQVLKVRRVDSDSGAGYGYFFWNFSFPVEDVEINGWFMAGNGGNIVALFPELSAVVVVTRTNFNSPTMARETIELLSGHILPTLIRGTLKQ